MTKVAKSKKLFPTQILCHMVSFVLLYFFRTSLLFSVLRNVDPETFKRDPQHPDVLIASPEDISNRNWRRFLSDIFKPTYFTVDKIRTVLIGKNLGNTVGPNIWSSFASDTTF